MTKPYGTGVKWEAIDAVIFDVDGTLFDHVALRRPMAVRLLRSLLTRRLRWRELRAVMMFRRERERLALTEADNIGRRQFERVAAATGRSRSEIEAVVTRWIYREPLSLVSRFAFPDVVGFVASLHSRGIRTGVFSDYPATDKLKAMGVAVEVVRDATAADVGRLKPNPDGFICVAQLLDVRPEKCLIVGDRDDRDGEAARRGGFVFLQKIAARSRPGAREFARYSELISEIERIPARWGAGDTSLDNKRHG
jgi:beta-phosphoglucomutase-like phosphatase (HAD superfamily)